MAGNSTADQIVNVQQMQSKYIEAFAMGTLKTMKIQANYELKTGGPFLLGQKGELKTDICGVIGLISSFFKGTVAICMAQPVFLGVMGSMFAESYSEMTDELADGIGEILNILFVQAKTTLTNQGIQFEMAIPTVVRGSDIKLTSLTNGNPTIVLPFDGKDGKLYLLVSLAVNKKKGT